MRADLLVGDCRDVMAGLEPESIDAIVADPPYGIGFMGHEWDQPDVEARRDSAGHRATAFFGPSHPAMEAGRYDRAIEANRAYQRWCQTWGAAALRVAKPGTHMLAFGGTRTVHRLTAGLEDAGWEIRDVLVWGYAEGFPKNLSVARSIDMSLCRLPGRHCMRKMPPEERRRVDDHVCPETEEGSAHRHEGTALKPAWEPIVMARKPLAQTIANTVLAYGTGALNIEGTRIPVDDDDPVNDAVWTSQPSAFREGTVGFVTSNEPGDRRPTRPEGGRWPANMMLTSRIFDGDTPGVVGGGASDGGIAIRRHGNQRSDAVALGAGIGEWPEGTPDYGFGDRGTYSRFFLVSKADRYEREPLITGSIEREAPPTWSSGEQSPGTFQTRPTPPRENTHPTVKPLDLMRHLVRLVTPTGGTVLDPFLGSGTTALAAEMEGLGWVGIERDPKYVAIAKARLIGIERGLGLDVPAPAVKAKRSSGRPWPDTRKPHGIMGSPWVTTGQQSWFEKGWTEDGDGHDDGRDPAADRAGAAAAE